MSIAKRVAALSLAVSAFMLAALPAYSDSLCPSPASQSKADSQFKEAQAAERAGKARDAYNTAARVNSDCVDDRRLREFKQRVAKVVAVDAEQSGKFEEAFDWYQNAASALDADRIMAKIYRAKSTDMKTIDHAVEYFKSRDNQVELKKLRVIATKNSDLAMADADKDFAQHEYNMKALALARDWERYTGNVKRVFDNAERHGDVLVADDLHRSLAGAMQYYRFANQRAKETQVKDKAFKLGESYERKGDAASALDYYRLAGADAKADALEKRTNAAAKQTEEVRRKKFNQDQKSLEKELDL